MKLIALLFILLSAPALADKAVFAGGCFWCMESDFQDLPGVTDVVSGFTGGTLKNPTYKGDHTGHYEAIEITYDPDQISYQQLLDNFWINIDPFDDGGQFCDRGFSYKAALFPQNDEQAALTQASLERAQAKFPGQEIVTPSLPASRFWPVEEYHQDYYKKNPIRYKYYRYRCGRDARLAAVWGER